MSTCLVTGFLPNTENWFTGQVRACANEEDAKEFAARCASNPNSSGTPYYIYQLVGKVESEVPPTKYTDMRG